MPMLRTVQGCRWAEPTLFLRHPLWLAAEHFPWTCNKDSEPRQVPDTAACERCRRWEALQGDRRYFGGRREL